MFFPRKYIPNNKIIEVRFERIENFDKNYVMWMRELLKRMIFQTLKMISNL